MYYKGTRVDTRLFNLENITVAKFNEGRVVDTNGQPLTISIGSQFVITGGSSFLITRDPVNVTHQDIAQGKPVRYAAMITINNGYITNLFASALSGYSGSPEMLVSLARYLTRHRIDLKDTRFSVVYFEPPHSRRSEDQKVIYDWSYTDLMNAFD